MSILTDSDVTKLLCTSSKVWDQDNQLLILDYEKDCLTPMGYDLRVGGFYKTFLGKSNLSTLKKGEKLIIKPRDIALIATLEQVKMPQNGLVSALILSKVSKVAQGLSHISTKVDPGWNEGQLLIPVQNILSEDLILDYGETFCTIIFFKNESPPLSLYNSDKGREKLVKLLAQVRKEKSFGNFWLAIVSTLVGALTTILIIYFYCITFKVKNDIPAAVIGGAVTFGIFLVNRIETIVNYWRDRR